ncbi:MAG: sugar nucleotide-binding protein [Bacteroidetes bacterium]|nr:sugar nucleotide-binding protein [Bacteroidota bacterium]
MKRKRVLITGGSGFLGQYLNTELNNKFEIMTTFRTNPGNCLNYRSASIDLRNQSALSNLFKNFKPEIIIHTAAYSTPDICNKTEKEDVINFNINLLKTLSEKANEYNSKLIFTSTDLVYKSNDVLINEGGALEPKSLYAETKVIAEEVLKENCKDYIILRTSLLYGLGLSHTRTHFQNMLEALENNEKVNLFFNQYRTPLEAKDGARIISELIEKNISNEIINFGGAEKISRYAMGELVCDVFGFDKNNLVKTDGQKMLGDIFVANVSMDTSKLQSYGIKQKSIKEVIIEIQGEIKKARLDSEEEELESDSETDF